MGDSRIVCKALRERIQYPDQLRVTISENIESTFIWKIEKFEDLTNSLLGIPIKTELGSLKNNSDSKVTSELQCKLDGFRSAFEYLEDYILKVVMTILSPNDYNNYSEKSVFLFDVNDYAIDYKRYLQNDTMTSIFCYGIKSPIKLVKAKQN